MSPITPSRARRWRAGALLLAASVALGGCASTANPKDPFEPFNRSMFVFNDAIDKAALKPAATAYKTVLPNVVQLGFANFFGNLSDVWSAANNLMQGKGAAGMSDVTRVALNSTFGLGGLLDIASEAGLQKHNEDFGQTLGHWGVASGPYVMLPLLGASTLRDTVALPFDIAADPWSHKEPARWRAAGTILRVVDERASVLDASNLMEEAALDRYEFIRDSFLQRRESRVNDGETPRRKKIVKDEAVPDAAGIKAAYADEPTPAAVPVLAPTPAAVAAPSVPVDTAPVSSEPVTK
jgi:phospholipid-binding lipoprotein MlaA